MKARLESADYVVFEAHDAHFAANDGVLQSVWRRKEVWLSSAHLGGSDFRDTLCERTSRKQLH